MPRAPIFRSSFWISQQAREMRKMKGFTPAKPYDSMRSPNEQWTHAYNHHQTALLLRARQPGDHAKPTVSCTEVRKPRTRRTTVSRQNNCWFCRLQVTLSPHYSARGPLMQTAEAGVGISIRRPAALASQHVILKSLSSPSHRPRARLLVKPHHSTDVGFALLTHRQSNPKLSVDL